MGLRPVVLFLVFLTVSFLFLGCGLLGGGDSEPSDMGLIEFGDDVAGDELRNMLESQEGVDQFLFIAPEVLIEIHFLHSFQVRLERLRGTIKDLNAAAETSGPVDVDLDWVIEVHEVTRESDDLFQVLTSMEIPESQRDQYRHLRLGMLEAIQVAGYGADRLLAASVVVGPSGRSMLNMSDDESDQFQVLIREARFFLSDAQGRVEGRCKRCPGLLAACP